ncbi:hypothetical protein SUGI_0469720 [Cryptomeria japonica]|nr:hypothetical protein SUGI_0469720 [Cryptomeria japonica]
MLEFRNSNNDSICSCRPGLFFMVDKCVSFSQISGNASENSHVFLLKNLQVLSGLSNPPSTFMWTTMAIVGLWLLLTFPLLWFEPRKGFLFRVRVSLTTWDNRFSLRHWVDDKKCSVKRSTELGGIMTVASWMLFAGLASSLAYDAISSDTVTIQHLTPAKRKDIQMFMNDIEVNVTTVGQLECNQIVGSKLSLSSDDGYMMNATAEDFSKPFCMDTSKGPLFRISCKGCMLNSDRYLFAWDFQDQLNGSLVASAIGFEINATASTFTQHKSTLGAILPGNYNGISSSAVTLRGSEWNVISLNFVPRIFRSKGDKKLMQIMFHMFTSGSYLTTINEMQDAFAKKQGVKVALQVNVLSDYLVETTRRSYFGVVKFLGYLGGLYIFARFLFLIIMIQFERNFPKLLIQEKRLNRLVAKERARAHWAKVRLFVKYARRSSAGKYKIPRNHASKLNYLRLFAQSGKKFKDVSSRKCLVFKQKFSTILSTCFKGSKSNHPGKEDLVESNQIEGTSGTLSYGENRDACSRYIFLQYRKPIWIREPEALPCVPEPPDFVSQLDDECERHAYLCTVNEYLRNMYDYGSRMRRDFLATNAVLEKVSWYFGQHAN